MFFGSPVIWVKNETLDSKNLPINVADAPRIIKTIENPSIKSIELKITLLIFFFPSAPSLNSSIEIPDMNDIYAGTRGKTHGEIKESKPAVKAVRN